MSDQEQALTVKIKADASEVPPGIDELQELQKNLEKIAGLQGDLGESADKAAKAQEDGAKRATDAQRSAAEAQKAIIDELKGKFSSASLERAAMAEAISNMEIALTIKRVEHETQMGRQSLEDQKARLEEIVAKTQEASAGRIAAERAVQAVNTEIIKQYVAGMQQEVAASKLSSEDQIANLHSIMEESEYALNVRKVAADEIARIESADAKAAAQAVVEAEREKVQAAKEAAAQIKQLEHETQMGRQSLEDQKARLEELVAKTQEASEVRMAAERAVQSVNAQLLEQYFSDMREEVAAARMSADEQRQILESLAEDHALNLKNRALASQELARIEAADAKASELAFREAEQLKVQEAKDAAAHIREAQKEAQEFAYVAMDIGYMLPGAGQLSNAAYLMRDLSSASGELLLKVGLLAAAFAAVAGSVDYFAHAVDDAGKMQEQLDQIGSAVRNQGGDWDADREKVEQWAATVERATTFSQSEILEAYNSLVSAGVKASDAQKLVTVSTDVAAGSGKKLIDVVNDIKGAEAGRGQGLVKLDENLKAIVQSHGSLQQVVDQLAHDFNGDAAAASDTYEGKQKQLKDTIGALSREIGIELLPTLTTGTEVLIGITEEVQKNAGTFVDWGRDVANSIGNVGRSIADLGEIARGVRNIFPHDKPALSIGNNDPRVKKFGGIGPSQDDTDALVDAGLGDLQRILQAPWENNSRTGGATGLGFLDDFLRKAQEAGNQARTAFEKYERETQLKNNVTLGRSGGGGVGSPAQSVDKIANQNEKLAQVQEKLKRQLQDLSDGEQSYRDKIELATSSIAKQHAEMALHQKVADDAQKAIKDITAANASLHAELNTLTPQMHDQGTAYEKARNDYEKFRVSLHGGAATTAEQKAKLQELKAALDQAWNAYNSTSQAVRALTNDLDNNNRELHQQQHNLLAVNIALAQSEAAYNDNKQRLEDERETYGKSLEWQADYWAKKRDLYTKNSPLYNQYQQKIDDIGNEAYKSDYDRAAQLRQLQEEEATYTLSLAQQEAYYSARYIAEAQANGQHSDEANRLAQKLISIEGEEYKQRADAHKQFIANLTKEETGFLDDILIKHQSFRDDLKTIWSDIEKNFAQSIEKMIVESGPLKNINESLFSSFSPSGGGGSRVPGGLASVAEAFGAGSPSGGPIGTSGNPAWVKLHPDTVRDFTGSPTGLSAAASDGTALPVSFGANADNVSPDDGRIFGDKPTGKQTTAGIMSGIGYGELATQITGGNQTWGTVGSVLGAGIGAALGGPVGAQIGGAIAGAIGGLFGPHETTQQTPDVSQPGYQQFLANYEGGVQNSHGTLTYAQGQYDTTIGNSSLADQISKYINNPSEWANAPAGVKADIQKLLALEGSSGSLALNTSNPEYQGQFNLANGKTVPVTDLETWVNELQQYQGQSGGTTPVYQLTRTYPTFTSKLGPEIGTVNNETDAFSPLSPDPRGATRGFNDTIGSSNTVNITVDLRNSVGTPSDDVINTIAAKLRDATVGFVPGAFSTTITRRSSGN